MPPPRHGERSEAIHPLTPHHPLPIPATPRLVSGSPPPPGPYDADIIILTMGRLAATLEAVASALAQTGITSYLALLDQGTDDLARARYTQIFAGHPRAGFYVSETNLGVPGGRNVLSNLGHGHIIAALDNDAVFAHPRIVAEALGIFAKTPKLAAIAFRIMDASGQKLDDASWGHPKSLKRRARQNFPATTFVGAGHAIARAAWQDAGGYDASLFFTWEEYDFSLRAIALGWHIAYRGDLAVHHKLAPESRLHWNAGRTQLYVRNRLIIARKWRASWLSLTPRILAYLLKFTLTGTPQAALSGTLAALRHPPKPRPKVSKRVSKRSLF